MFLNRRQLIRLLIALFLVILISPSLVEAAPLNNPVAEQPKEVVSEPVQERTEVKEAPVVQPPAPKPQPKVAHPVGCENYRSLYTEIFGSKADVFLRIASKESGCNPLAVGDKHLTYFQNGIKYGMSCGLLQVRFLPGRPSCAKMQDPAANARYALSLYNSGGFNHWSVCKNGSANCY